MVITGLAGRVGRFSASAVPLVGIALVAALLAGCGGGAGSSGGGDAPDTDVAALVADRCTVCHSIDRIKNASHDRDGWADTVQRMRAGGARLTDAEAQSVIDFLSEGGASEL